MKKSKKVIYLSLSDLKELGIIKKRSKRRRRHGSSNKNSNSKAYNNESGGIRSSSDHMVGSSISTPFTNSSNLSIWAKPQAACISVIFRLYPRWLYVYL